MYNDQNMEGAKKSGTEFLKVYALTLFSAFVLMAAVQYRLGDESISYFKTEQVPPKKTAPSITPIAEADDFFPIRKLKNLFVKLSF